MALGGILGNLAIPPLAAVLGTGTAFAAGAVVALLGALACLGLPHSTRDEAAVESEAHAETAVA
jgi:hypothetical protein